MLASVYAVVDVTSNFYGTLLESWVLCEEIQGWSRSTDRTKTCSRVLISYLQSVKNYR